MKKRYVTVIVTKSGWRYDEKEYECANYSNIGDAMEAIDELVETFKAGNDEKIVDVYVRNIITGKIIRR